MLLYGAEDKARAKAVLKARPFFKANSFVNLTGEPQ